MLTRYILYQNLLTLNQDCWSYLNIAGIRFLRHSVEHCKPILLRSFRNTHRALYVCSAMIYHHQKSLLVAAK